MNKEPNREVEIDEEPVVDLVKALRPSPTPSRALTDPELASSPDGSVDGAAPPTIDITSDDGLVNQMLPPNAASGPPAATRFNTAAPLAPPRPGPTGMPTRASNVPAAPRIPASQAMEKMTELQEQLELAKRTVNARDAEIRTLLTQRDARIAELEAVKSQLAAREFSIKELEFAVLAKETKVRDLETEIESLRSPGEGPGDDLQQIRGIGRGFERELKRIGVRTFAQIAAWTPAEVEAIAVRIKAQPERIRRDGWVQHASELLAQRTK